MATDLKRRLQVILISNSKIFDGPRSFHRLYGWTGLLEMPDVLRISLLSTTTVLIGIRPRQDNRRL